MEPRPPNKRTSVKDSLLYYEPKRAKKCSCLAICCIVCCVTIFILLLAAVLIVFVGIPYLFKNSPELQRKLIFPTTNLAPTNPQFTNFRRYDIQGARNVYVTAGNNNTVSLGVWHLLPHALTNSSIHDDNYDYSNSLARADFPVIIHFHSNGGNRIKFTGLYNILRNYFHVIAFDYRGYGDSSKIPPYEDGIVEDSLALYRWVREQTRADIYFWGHALGAALATNTIGKLRDDDIVPMGLFLEAPFSNIRDQVHEIPLLRKLYSWLPFYESTILDSLEVNGFYLNTTKYVHKVDCPIMIIHAEDDAVTPYALGMKVLKAAQERDLKIQGSVTYHLVPTKYECGHYNIFKAPELSHYIKNHTIVCEKYKRERG